MSKLSGKAKLVSILLLIAMGLYFFTHNSLPQYSRRIPLFAIYLLLELFFYYMICGGIKPINRTFQIVLKIFWWLPVVLFVGFLITASILPLQEWNKPFQIYLPGVAIMALIAKIVFFVALVPALLLQILKIIFIRRSKVSDSYHVINKFLKRMAFFLGGLAFIGLFIGSIHWVSMFKTREVEVPIANLPDSLKGLRIVQLSDIHLGSWATTKPLQNAVDIVNDLHPDVVLFTGDMVNYSAKETRGFESILSNVKAPLGVYAIMGNHDYGDYVPWPDPLAKENDIKYLESFYKKIGWKLLRNENTVLNIKGSSILLAGVENWSATSRFHKYGDMKLTMKGAPQTDVSILLSHDPTHWDAEVIKKYPRFDLTLAGHTHGMQIGFEGFGIKWSPSQYMFKNWGGMYQNVDKSQKVSRLYVNLGLGHIGYPGRVGMLPEITLITLADLN